jgi:Holliday junction resolvase
MQLKLDYELNIDENNIGHYRYSKSKFGRDAEITISLYMMSRGWHVTMSRGSRGPADLYAKKESRLWCVQVKASTKSPCIKGLAIRRLIDHALQEGGHPVLAILQPSFRRHICEKLLYHTLLRQKREHRHTDLFHPFESFYFSFYHLPSWHQLIA